MEDRKGKRRNEKEFIRGMSAETKISIMNW